MKFCTVDKMHLGGFAGMCEAEIQFIIIFITCFQLTREFVCPIVIVGVLRFFQTRFVHFTQICEFYD